MYPEHPLKHLSVSCLQRNLPEFIWFIVIFDIFYISSVQSMLLSVSDLAVLVIFLYSA